MAEIAQFPAVSLALPPSLTRRSDRWRLAPLDVFPATVVFAAALTLYVRTLQPTVGFSDTAEFQYAIATMTVPHPTGYPLYVFIGKLFTFLPFGNEAYRVNLLSAVCTAGAASFVYLIARMIGVGWLAGFVAALAFAASPDAWYWATIAKTYPLHIFLLGAIVMALIGWANGALSLVWVALLVGISFGNHRGMALVLPAFVLFWLVVRRPRIIDVLTFRAHRPDWRVVTAFLAPWLMYLWIPITGIPGHVGFWETLNYGATGSSLIAQIETYQMDIAKSSSVYFLTMIPREFGLLAPVGFAGFALLLLGRPASSRIVARRVGVLLVGAYLGILSFHIPFFGGDIAGFLLPTFWLLAIGIAVGLSEAGGTIVRFGAARSSRLGDLVGRGAVGALAVVLLWFGPWASVTQNYALLDRSNDRQHEQRANTLLNALEPNAVLVLNEDWLAIWQIKYQRYIAGVRPDTIVIHGAPDVELRRALETGRPAYSMAYAPSLAAENRLMPVLSFWKALTAPLTYRPLQPVDVTFDGKLRLEGWTTPSVTIAPGGILPVLLRWQVLQDLDTDYVVFVHLLDSAGRSPAGWDAQPLLGESQTSTWRNGDRHDDPHGLLLPTNLAPGRYSLAVGLYPEGSSARLPMTAPGAPTADRVVLGPLRVGMGAAATPVGAPRNDSFGGLMTLIGLDVGAPQSGALPVALSWRADQSVPRDYTLTLQLLDSTGAMVAQLDRQPVNNTYPTSLWERGEIIVDRYRLPVANVTPGQYRLIAAWYDDSVRRLPVNGADHLALGTVTLP